MKKTSERVITFTIVTILSWVVLLGYYSLISNYNGSDYSKEYNIYKSVHDKTNLEDITSELEKQKIDYTIENTVISLDDYSNISFEIDFDNSCEICSNEIMESFKILDTKDIKKVIEKGKYNKSSNSYVKSYEYKNCTLVANKYYYISPIVFSVIIALLITFIISCFFFSIKTVSYILVFICKYTQKRNKRKIVTKSTSYDNAN